MSFLGKLLVVLHGGLSIAVLGWAVGVYTNRIDWNTPPTQAGKEPPGPGLFDRQKAQIDQYNGAVDRAYTRWSGNLAQVQLLENERYPRRTFYAGQLALVKSGTFNGQPVQNPVQELVTDPRTGYLDVTRPTGRNPILVREGTMAGMGIAADSIAGYNRKITKLVEDIQASQMRNAEAIIEREKLNREIVGVTQPTLIKGLRTLLTEQKTIEDQAGYEDVYVAGFVTNREAEFGLLKKRRDAMTARMAELDKVKKDN